MTVFCGVYVYLCLTPPNKVQTPIRQQQLLRNYGSDDRGNR